MTDIKSADQTGLKFVNTNPKTVDMKRSLILLALAVSQIASAQFHLGVFAGGVNYTGELNNRTYTRTKFAGGISLNYEVSDRVMLRSGLTFGSVDGADRFGTNEYVKQTRNLSFQTSITEFSLVGELTAFNLYNIRWSPYAFAGLSVYRFNPYVTDSAGGKTFLQPLGTEGQGLSAYPERKPYNLTQLAIPFGGGIKYNINDNIRLGFEVGLRRLFTDYLDDVSTTYADEALLAASNPNTVRFAYRGREVQGGDLTYPDNGYPSKDAPRGNPDANDWLYFTGLHLTFRLGGGEGKGGSGKKNGRYGCPTVPM